MNILKGKNFRQILLGNNQEGNYICFEDRDGNKLESTDIGFTSLKLFEGTETLEMWDISSYEDEMRNYLYVQEGYGTKEEGYPVFIKRNGKTANIKINLKSEEPYILPRHAGSVPAYRIGLVGASDSGKTVFDLQVTGPGYLNMLARNTDCAFTDDMPNGIGERLEYEAKRQEMLADHNLPEPTRISDEIPRYYIHAKNIKTDREVLLEMVDIDGEQCQRMKDDSHIFFSNVFILTVGADELLKAKRGENVEFINVMNQFLPRLNESRGKGNYKIMVMITKADCLEQENKIGELLKENTIEEREDGMWIQTTHGDAFDHAAFEEKSQIIREYFRDNCPNIYNCLVAEIPEPSLSFSMIASIGEQAHQNHFQTYKPYGIDEPMVKILAECGVYPMKNIVKYADVKEQYVDDNRSKTWNEMKKVFETGKEKCLEIMQLSGKDEDE